LLTSSHDFSADIVRKPKKAMYRLPAYVDSSYACRCEYDRLDIRIFKVILRKVDFPVPAKPVKNTG
jgi:hypothetical protein